MFHKERRSRNTLIIIIIIIIIIITTTITVITIIVTILSWPLRGEIGLVLAIGCPNSLLAYPLLPD